MSLLTGTLLALAFLPVPLLLLYLKAKETKHTNNRDHSNDHDKLELLNCPQARAHANKSLKDAFGIENSFVSACIEVRKTFKSEMIKRKLAMDSRLHELDGILSNAISDLPSGYVSLKDVAQKLTMKVVLEGLLPDMLSAHPAIQDTSLPPMPNLSTNPTTRDASLSPMPGQEDMEEAARLIEQIWSAKEAVPHLTTSLHDIFKPTLLSRLIPTWESQWRVVYYSLLEWFRRRTTATSDRMEDLALLNSGQFVKEVLRLYAPVKSVKRKTAAGLEVSFPIATEMRARATWGEDAEEFKPNRSFTEAQEKELQKVFGMGELKCIAGIKFVQMFCGKVIEHVALACEAVDVDEWSMLPSPLVNERGRYETLLITRVA